MARASITSPLALALLLLATACGPSARPYRPTVRPAGEGWWCATDSSASISYCGRTAESCADGVRTHQNSGEVILLFGDCKQQARAYCFADDPPSGDHPQFVDACYADSHTCELGRSRKLQGGSPRAHRITACGTSD